MLNNIKEMIGKEMSFLDLDNEMIDLGYYSVLNDGVTENIKQDKNVVYTNTTTNEAEILINFEIVIDNSADEVEEYFYLKVIDISNI